MKAYGLVDRTLRGCCPGHDAFPRESYNNRRSIKKHRSETLRNRRRERRLRRQNLRNSVADS